MKLVSLFVLAALQSFAGPAKEATYPVVHPVKTAKAVKAGTKGVLKAVKAIVW